MSLIEQIHSGYLYNRRVRVLTNHLAELLPQDARVLDVGCGDGLLALRIMQKRPDVEIRGIDILIRSQTHIPVHAFEGQVIPYGDASFDVVMFIDVLHHTEDPMILLREAVRAAWKAVVIKDHILSGLFAGLTLRFMDRVGNARHGVSLSYKYWSQERWFEAFEELGLIISVWERKLPLYPPPASWICGRSLHFIARLDVK